MGVSPGEEVSVLCYLIFFGITRKVRACAMFWLTFFPDNVEELQILKLSLFKKKELFYLEEQHNHIMLLFTV